MNWRLFVFCVLSFPCLVFAGSCGWQNLFLYPCFCESNRFNCSDFSSAFSAQYTFECCFSKVGTDIHELDADKDKKACEGLK